MKLIEHWGSGIPRIIGKVKADGLREPEFIGGEVDLRINIYRGQIDDASGDNKTDKVPDNEQARKIYQYVLENGYITTYNSAMQELSWSLEFKSKEPETMTAAIF